MTPEQAAAHLEWLNDMNGHIAIGGKLESQYRGNWEINSRGPSWNSDPKIWRKAPLPRTNQCFIAYVWRSNGEFIASIHTNPAEMNNYKNAGYTIQEITVTEELK